MFTDEWQMYCLEKSEHASVAAKTVLFLSSEKKDCQVQSKGFWPRTGEWDSFIFIVLVPELSLELEIFYLI